MMNQAEQVRVLNELIDMTTAGVNVNAGVTLKNPVSSYVDQDLAAREWHAFFLRAPADCRLEQ